MVFLHINPSEPNTNLLNDAINSGKPVFVLFYLEGCGPCEATRPEWKKMENVLPKYKTDKNFVIADVDQSFMKSIRHVKPITGFPTIRFIKGQFSEDYEKSSIKVKDRRIDSFVKWIKSKTTNKEGVKKSRKYNKNRRDMRKNKTRKHYSRRKQ